MQTMWKQIQTHRKQMILALASSLLLILAFPKADQGWLAWIAIVPLMLSVRNLGWRESFFIGFGAGLVYRLGLIYWTVHSMHIYGRLSVTVSLIMLVLLAAYLALYTALFTAAIAWLCTRPWLLVVLAPLIWTGLEWLQGWLFSGFPWELLGYSQYDRLWVIQIADLFGVYGLSALIVFFNAVLTVTLLHWGEKQWQTQLVPRSGVFLSGIVLFALFIAVAGYGGYRLHTMGKMMASAPNATVSVVQGNINQAQKWDPRFQVLATVKYKGLSKNAAEQGTDLIIWPETATPFYLLHDKLLTQMVVEGIKAAKTHFIIGSPAIGTDQGKPVYFNSAFVFGPDGEMVGKYDKVHLVPFGEYVPLQRFLPFIDKLVAQVGDFERGRKGNTLKWQSHSVGMLICYEVIFPGLARSMVQNGAHLLVNITNDAWFGRTSAARQHFSMAVFRAVENRRTLARAANTGISGFIDPIGRIVAETVLFTEAAISAKVVLLDHTTPYGRWGDWPMLIVCFGLIAAAVALRALDYQKSRGTGRNL